MALGMNYDTSGGGDFLPIVKYDARAGRIFRVDRLDRVNNPVDITRSFKAVIDLENIEVGWLDFNTGGAPVMALARYGDPFPANPGGQAKQGVRMLMKLGKECGGDVREMATSAKAAMRGIDALHTAYQEGEKQNPGKLPVVALADTIAITTEGQGQKTTNYEPVFEIVGWVARPVDLEYKPRGAPAADSNGTSHRPAPPATGSTQVKPPAAKAAATADADDFG
jgi:hypothetical protein